MLARRKLAHHARGRRLRGVGRGAVRLFLSRNKSPRHAASVATEPHRPVHAMEGDPLMAVEPNTTPRWWRRSREDPGVSGPIPESFPDLEPVPGLWLEPGQLCEIEITEVGRIANRVVDAAGSQG